MGIGSLILAIMLIGMALIPAVSAQKEDNYSVTAEEAFKHANAHMISFITTDSPGFENWTGASIDPNPQELYDINGQKLFYQFSVYKEKKLIGTIDIFANKTLGNLLNDIAFDPYPYNATEAMDKSIEITKENYPDGEITSTKMVVYSYPKIGAMTIVKDKSGVEHRIFVDVYTLDVVPDKPATESELGVWSMSKMILENGVEENLKEWEKSDQLTNSIEQAATDKEVNISVAVTEENINKLSGTVAITDSTSKILGVPLRGQETDYYCIPASCQMIAIYYDKIPTPSQTYIYEYEGGRNQIPLFDEDAEDYCEDELGKSGTVIYTHLTNVDAIDEIDNNRPFFSMITQHSRVCKGYIIQNSYTYLYINDPLPVGSNGTPKLERTYGSSEVERIYVRE
ncbi:C39 family peptidase [Methanosarcina mazei]|uniref:C39 family peptidase n=1 Tax=Methanosarcina mazei TaxID=2209 RepID=UPI001F2001F5|nr:C39 family peptidase [Methanosarcina mazei]